MRTLSKALWGLLLLAGASDAFALKVVIDGSLPSNLSTNTFELTVSVTEVKATELCPNGAASFVEPSIVDVAVGAGETTANVRVLNSSGGVPVENADPDYIATPLRAPDVDATACSNQNDDTSFTITYTVEGTETGKLAGDVADDVLTVAATLSLGGSSIGNEVTGTLAVDVTAPNEAPAFTAVEAGNGFLRVRYSPPGVISFRDAGGATASKTPSQVYAIAFERGSQIPSLPGFLHSPDGENGDVPDTSCNYTPLADGVESGACVVDCGENIYLDVSTAAGLRNNSLINIGSATASTGTALIQGLTNDKIYDVTLMFESNGLVRTACRAGVPTEDFTLTEINGAKGAEDTKFLCMIATAAYGSALHEDLVYFRWFRDTKLKGTGWGDSLVQYYYNNSTPLAQNISKNEALRVSTRASLWPVALALKGWFWLENGRLAHQPQ